MWFGGISLGCRDVLGVPGSADRLGSRGSTTQRTNSTRHRQNHYTAIREITALLTSAPSQMYSALCKGQPANPSTRSE
jgi:hypothetical protein